MTTSSTARQDAKSAASSKFTRIRISVDFNDLSDRLARRETIERRVDVVEPDALAQQPVHWQAPVRYHSMYCGMSRSGTQLPR